MLTKKQNSDIAMNNSNINHNNFKEVHLGRGFWLACFLGVVGILVNALPKIITAIMQYKIAMAGI